MATPLKMSAEDKRWQAEDDARALINAEVVKKDATRYKAAKVQLVRMEGSAG